MLVSGQRRVDWTRLGAIAAVCYYALCFGAPRSRRQTGCVCGWMALLWVCALFVNPCFGVCALCFWAPAPEAADGLCMWLDSAARGSLLLSVCAGFVVFIKYLSPTLAAAVACNQHSVLFHHTRKWQRRVGRKGGFEHRKNKIPQSIAVVVVCALSGPE